MQIIKIKNNKVKMITNNSNKRKKNRKINKIKKN